MTPARKEALMRMAGVSGVNKPKRTPNHPKKSHVVVAQEGDRVKLIRFGQQGVSGRSRTVSVVSRSRLGMLRILLRVRCLLLIGLIR